MSAYEGLEHAVKTLQDLRARKLQEAAEIESAIADIVSEMERLPKADDAEGPRQPLLDDSLRP
ncbi:hypothetical protein [Luteitalea sp.]|jgi:hypothetical protein|uniref:hypothetical protein n=1 Tax=Luteitalea sp. TaxID=2004800 RepID=UPI0037CA2AAF